MANGYTEKSYGLLCRPYTHAERQLPKGISPREFKRVLRLIRKDEGNLHPAAIAFLEEKVDFDVIQNAVLVNREMMDRSFQWAERQIKQRDARTRL